MQTLNNTAFSRVVAPDEDIDVFQIKGCVDDSLEAPKPYWI